jgi:hypothetical protein
MQNAEGISDRQSSAEQECEFRSKSSDVYVGKNFAALQIRVDDVSSESDVNEAESAYTTPIMQAHAMSPS